MVNTAYGKAPLEESTVANTGFEDFEENNYRVIGKEDNSEQQRIPSSNEEEQVEKEDPKPTPWNYLE